MKTRKVSVRKVSDGVSRRSPWAVRYWINAHTPRQKFFPTKEEAEVYATQLRKDLAGRTDESLLDAGAAIDLATSVAEYIEGQKNLGLRPATLRGKLYRVNDFAKAFAGRTLPGITAVDIEGYVHERGSANSTKRAVLVQLTHLFKVQGVKFPEVKIVFPIEDESEVEYFPAADAKAILELAPDKLKAGLAIQLFAGIRTGEVQRLTDANINRVDRLIRIPAAAAKKRRARVLTTLPRNLWEIRAAVEFDPVNYQYRRRDYERELRSVHGVPWVRNGLRHSFATYHTAWKGYEGERHFNLCETADILGHLNGLDLLNRHYRGLATVADADAYFRIGLKAAGKEVAA